MNIAEFCSGGALLKVNLTTRSIFVNGRIPTLSPSEQEVVLHFASHPGRVISKEGLLDTLYSLRLDHAPEIKIIDVFICKVRRKLGEIHPDAEKLIKTVWGQGYRLESDGVSTQAA